MSRTLHWGPQGMTEIQMSPSPVYFLGWAGTIPMSRCSIWEVPGVCSACCRDHRGWRGSNTRVVWDVWRWWILKSIFAPRHREESSLVAWWGGPVSPGRIATNLVLDQVSLSPVLHVPALHDIALFWCPQFGWQAPTATKVKAEMFKGSFWRQ